MTYQTEKKKYSFTFTWNIENFIVCPKKLGEALLSPSFTVECLGATEWRLNLYPRGSKKPGYTACYLQRLNGASRLKEVLVNFRITILSCDLYNGNYTKCGKSILFGKNEFWGFTRFIKRSHIESFLLSPFQHKLTVRCDLSPSDDYSRVTLINEKLSMQILSLNYSNLYESKNFHDIILLCNGLEFIAHQTVIYTRAPKFAAELKLENHSRTIITREVDTLTASALENLLTYIYTGRLNILECDVSSELYIFSIEYHLPDLQRKLRTYPSQCTGRTCMNVELQTISLPVKTIASLQKGKEILSRIIPLEDEDTGNLIIHCSFNSHSLGIDRMDLSIRFSKFNTDRPVSILCRINVLHEDGSLLDFFDGNEFFEYSKEWNIPFFIQKWGKQDCDSLMCSALTFFCDLTMCYGERTSYIESSLIDAKKTLPYIIDYGSLSWDFSKLLFNILYSDVSIVSEDVTFPAHRAIIAARSPVFRKMFQHNMIENIMRVVLIRDFSAPIVKAFLVYIYSGTIDILSTDMKSLYAVADKYDVQSLRENCRSVLKSLINIENSCDLIILSYKHCDNDLMVYARKYARFHTLKVIQTLGWKELKRTFYNLANEILPGYA